MTEYGDYNGLLNRVTQGDCLEIMKLIPDKSIDMILCDLPYGNGKTALKWDCIIPLNPLWEQYKRIIKDNGAIVLTSQQPFTSQLIMSEQRLFRYELIWDKDVAGAFVLAKKRPLPRHENILVFYKKAPTYNPQMTDADPKKIRPISKKSTVSKALPVASGKVRSADDYNPSKRYPTSIIKYSARAGECNSLNRLHETQKPVALFEWLIKTYTNEGEVVLDNCIGSGTTAVAAINTNRQFIGIEREAKYVEIANKRIAEALERKTGGTSEISKG
ncbi:DNA-methyltransferase [Geobacillus phage vB_GthS_PK3.5]|nr:DNA-methyltransferase [Geobacillus phage vB_GthS_PK3.5]